MLFATLINVSICQHC